MAKKVIEEIFEAPAKVLDESVHLIKKGEMAVINKKPFRLAKEYMNTLGPGLTTGAADDDPSGIATYSQTGARYGFNFLWLTLFSLPFMAVVQEMCGRIGLVSGRGLAGNIRLHYSHRLLYFVTFLLFLANTLNLAADLGAMAASARLLFPVVPAEFFIILFAIICLLLQIYTTYARYARYLKYMTLALFSYVLTAFAVHVPWGEAFFHTIVPSITFSKDQLFILCAFLGTTISPYLFFWQTSQEVEEEILAGKTKLAERQDVAPREIKKMQRDTWSGMIFSNLVSFFIIVACAATLYTHGITSITSADEAASAIRPFAGELTYLFFTLGIIGTGLLAVPILAGSSAYAIAESFHWRHGLYRKLHQAYAFYGVIIVSVILGSVGNFLRIDPIQALLYAAAFNGVVAPVVLFFIIRLSSSKHVMYEYTSRPLTRWVGWLIFFIMSISGIAAIVSFFL